MVGRDLNLSTYTEKQIDCDVWVHPNLEGCARRMMHRSTSMVARLCLS